MTKFSEMLLLELDKRNIKQGEFAKTIGVCRQTVNRWISGREEPKLSQIYKVAKALKISPKRLI